jgi:Flp pilus assembly protein TadD
MSRRTQETVIPGGVRSWRNLTALAACTMLGACAQSGKPSLPELLSQNEAATQAPVPEQPAASGKNELMKATEYWGQLYAKDPRNLEAALSYAKNLKAMGEKQRALSVLQQASVFHGNSRELAGEYGRLALEFDQISLADRLLAAADDPVNPDWRVISARGTVLAKQGKYKDAIPYYERALTFAHDHPSILSNLALAHAMNGDPKRAEAMLRQAAASDRDSLKIRQNLALVLGLQGKYDEAKLLASHDMPAESAAENADYLRRIVKLEPDEPHASETPRSVAKAKRPARPTVDSYGDDDPTEAPPAPIRTSKKTTEERRKVAAQTAAPLRGTMMPGQASETETKKTGAAQTETATQQPEDAPSIAASFSVAQWMPQTAPAPLEGAAKAPAAAKDAWQESHGE